MSGFGSNISSLRAQRRLAEGTSLLQQTYERLSSGQRINRAGDDAAGLSIADTLRVNSRLYSAGARNINDGLSMISVADGTLENQSSIIMRLKELAEQSANGVFSSSQRSTLNQEYQTLLKEFGRLGDASSFNGISLLRSGGSSTSIQAGITGNRNSSISFINGETGTLSGVIDLSQHLDPDDGGNDLFTSGTFAELAASQNYQMIQTRVRDANGNWHDAYVGFHMTGQNSGYENRLKFEIFLRASEAGGIGGQGSTVQAGDEWAFSGSITVDYVADGSRLTTPLTSALLSYSTGASETTLSLDFSAVTFIPPSSGGAPQTAIDFTGIESVARAQNALDVLSNRLQDISQIRARYGATQSRLLSALELNRTSAENSKAAESRIRDVDVASETARLTTLQILQKAAESILASANQLPQLYLELLKP